MSQPQQKNTELDLYIFRQNTLEGNWKDVIETYRTNKSACREIIDSRSGTALHVAVNDGNYDAVKDLVEAICMEEKEDVIDILKVKDVNGDTPLHLAASCGFWEICQVIIGEKHERKELVSIENNEGEAPLFVATRSHQKLTFSFLSEIPPLGHRHFLDLFNKKGDSVLHCAIRNEFLDLAIIIVGKYPFLVEILNNDGYTPLKLLATRPSAFESGSSILTRWTGLFYIWMPVDTQGLELWRRNEDNEVQRKKKHAIPSGTLEGDEHQIEISVPWTPPTPPAPNLAARLGQLAVRCLKPVVSRLSGIDLYDIQKMKLKHKLGVLLLNMLVEDDDFEWYIGRGGRPPLDPEDHQLQDEQVEADENPYLAPRQKEDENKGTDTKKNEDEKKKLAAMVEVEGKDTVFWVAARYGILEDERKKLAAKQNEDEKKKLEAMVEVEGKQTVFLVAARYGIREIVRKVLEKIPTAYRDTTLDNKNVLLVAAENKHSHVLLELKRKFREKKGEVWNKLILGVDKEGNTMSHLAAQASSKTGYAPQMMWDIKWFQYIQKLVPEHYNFRVNERSRTAWEIFKETHHDLMKESSTWLKDTSTSCSVVAALNAGVSFATIAQFPGGPDDKSGEPVLMDQFAFTSFAIASVFALTFSVTSLVAFLSILTARNHALDFTGDLPRKLSVGIISLFISIAALFVSFCSGTFYEFCRYRIWILTVIYIVCGLPVLVFAIGQLPLAIDLLNIIYEEVPKPTDKREDL